jgi:hypothetical protein
VINPVGEENQLNFFEFFEEGPTRSDYNSDTADKEYNYGCYKCHTTGTEDNTNKNWLEDNNVQTSGNFVRHHEPYDEFIYSYQTL